MDETAVRESAEAFGAALVAGDVDRAIEDFSQELHRNLGEVISLLPLPANEVTVESIEHGASAYVVVLRLVGETDEIQLQTRWKDRDGRPTIVEVSHLSQKALEGPAGEEGTEGEGEAAEGE